MREASWRWWKPPSGRKENDQDINPAVVPLLMRHGRVFILFNMELLQTECPNQKTWKKRPEYGFRGNSQRPLRCKVQWIILTTWLEITLTAQGKNLAGFRPSWEFYHVWYLVRNNHPKKEIGFQPQNLSGLPILRKSKEQLWCFKT